MTCGVISDWSWSGVIMKSACSLLKNHNTNDCQTIEQLNMTLQQELPVFEWNNNVTYRSIACAKCNNGRNLSFWGLKVTCPGSLEPPQQDNIAVKTFVEENDKYCKWAYVPFPNLRHRQKSCVTHDSQCASNQLPVMAVTSELCSSYSMAFQVEGNFYRNPHCALCNPKGRQQVGLKEGTVPPLSILFDMSSPILQKREPQTAPPTTHGFNLTSQVLNCSSAMKNCSTVSYEGKTCWLLTSQMNQTTQMNISRVKVQTTKQILLDNDAIKPGGGIVFILCPEHEKYQQYEFPGILILITFTGTLLSIISLCFLLSVYLSFKELRNLPGKCLISLSWALLCYQIFFLFAEKSNEVYAACKVVAVCLHFFVLAAFSWMSIMAFDTSSTFKVQGKLNYSTSTYLQQLFKAKTS